MGRYSGLSGLIVLAIDVYAIIHIVQSSETTGTKVAWVLLVLVLPLVGALIWYFFGPRTAQP